MIRTTLWYFYTIKKMTSSTPLNKRPCSEMLFSPEGQAVMDKSSVCDLLSTMLDDKFKEHILPVKEDISALKSIFEKRQQENCQKFDCLQERCKQLQAENNVLKDKLNKLETF